MIRANPGLILAMIDTMEAITAETSPTNEVYTIDSYHPIDAPATIKLTDSKNPYSKQNQYREKWKRPLKPMKRN